MPYKTPEDEHDEGYYASFTDLLIGVLFIFILLLMIFATTMRKSADQVTGMIESRNVVLNEIKRSLHEQGVEVQIDEQQGVLRLPDKILFQSGSDSLNADGKIAVAKLANVLNTYLPCLTVSDIKAISDSCAKLKLKSSDGLDAVLVEGHTDSSGRATGFDNWRLSTNRAINMFLEITKDDSSLDSLLNTRGYPLFAVSGYEARRPIDPKDTRIDNPLNRRIDLRFMMRSPTPEDVHRIYKAMEP